MANFWKIAARSVDHMSRVMRKPTICICENKDADQLRGNRESDQRLCFRYIDSTVPLLSNQKPERWFSHDAAHMFSMYFDCL